MIILICDGGNVLLQGISYKAQAIQSFNGYFASALLRPSAASCAELIVKTDTLIKQQHAKIAHYDVAVMRARNQERMSRYQGMLRYWGAKETIDVQELQAYLKEFPTRTAAAQVFFQYKKKRRPKIPV